MRWTWALVLISSAALPGCLQPDGAQPRETDSATNPLLGLSWEQLGALAYSDSHDHRDRTLHTEISRGLRLLNASALSTDGKSLGEYTEADHERGLIAVAVVTGPGSSMRIVLLNDSALPEVRIVGHFDEPNSYGDVKLDPRLPLVYVPYASGRAFSIWDVSDLQSPRRVGEAAGAGCHMLHVLHLEDQPHVFCASLGGSKVYRIVTQPGGQRTGVLIGIAAPQSDPEVARYATYYAALTPIGPALLTTPHDQTAQLDPLTKQPILVTAHELQGIRVFDVGVPSAPREIGHWRGQGMREPLERVHTVGLAAINGKRIGFGATETFTNVAPSLYIVDFTDYANPRFLARWTPPGVPNDQGITFSLHNLQVVETRLYLTNFHAGLWVMDIDDPARPEIVALRTPVRDTEYPRPGEASKIGPFTIFNDMNQYWDIIVVNGYAVVTDMAAGIEVLHVDGDPAGDSAWDGFT